MASYVVSNDRSSDVALPASLSGDQSALGSIYENTVVPCIFVARKVPRNDDALAEDDLTGFALTREVAGGVVSSAGDVVAGIADA